MTGAERKSPNHMIVGWIYTHISKKGIGTGLLTMDTLNYAISVTIGCGIGSTTSKEIQKLEVMHNA